MPMSKMPNMPMHARSRLPLVPRTHCSLSWAHSPLTARMQDQGGMLWHEDNLLIGSDCARLLSNSQTCALGCEGSIRMARCPSTSTAWMPGDTLEVKLAHGEAALQPGQHASFRRQIVHESPTTSLVQQK